jgi:hypothetical protein
MDQIDRATAATRSDPYAAARAAVEAKEQLGEARRRLSETPADAPPVIVDAAWQPLDAALHAHRERLLAIPGVAGFGLATRRRGGIDVGEPCVVVYVIRKRSPGTLARKKVATIPATLSPPGGGQSVPVDVVAVGGLKRLLVCGASIGHAAVELRDRAATLGLVATDNFTGRPVALTAMHLTGLEEFPPGEPIEFLCPDASQAGSLPLGLLLKGTMSGVDAAKIGIRPGIEAQRFVRGIGPIEGTRILSHPGDTNTSVQLFGAKSGLRHGVIDTPRNFLPEFGLGEVILVNIQARRGDSGAAVLDMDRRVLGLLVGELEGRPGVHVVSPIRSILLALNCTF